MSPRGLSRDRRDQICKELRDKGHTGWLVVFTDGTYILDHLYPSNQLALDALATKDPTDPIIGGTIMYVGSLVTHVTLCPSCKSIRKAGEVCPLCKCPPK